MNIKSILTTAFLLASFMTAGAQTRYLNVKIADGQYKSFEVTPNLKVTWDLESYEEIKPAIGKGTAKAMIDNVETDVNWVQLWEGGPMFAEYNIGATSETDYGCYFMWGGTTKNGSDYPWVNDHNGDKHFGDVLTGADEDAATKYWGNDWRMPTKEDFDILFDAEKCTCTWKTNYKQSGINGLWITGKGDYSGNGVFLPAAGVCSENRPNGQVVHYNENGVYWSSTADTHPYSAYSLIFKLDGDELKLSISWSGAGSCCSIRPVYDPATTGTAKATINSVETDVNWVQLWDGGPKFAEYNVGVTDGKAESFGGYYFWGGNIDKDPAQYWKNGSDALTGDDDTATKLWGNKWRMLTNDEFDELLKKCDVLWTTENGVKGMLCTGKGKYSSNSIFLPAAGEYWTSVSEWGIGKYWTSTPSNDYQTYVWNFDEYGFKSVSSAYRYFAHSVRAVLVE